MSRTALSLKTEILNQIWPSGIPENLSVAVTGQTKSAYDHLFDEALAEIAKWVDSEKVNHVDVIPFCATWWKCGMTVVPAPVGVINRVGTIITGEYCGPVWYRRADWPAPEWFGKKLVDAYADLITTPTATLDLGLAPANATADATVRALTGIWSLERKNLYIAPWIQSTESLLIEWDGIKNSWADADLVTDTTEYKKAVKLYVQYAHERDYGSYERSLTFHNPAKTGTFDEALADLMWQDRENTRMRPTRMDPDQRDALPVVAVAPLPTATAIPSHLDVTDTVTGTTYRLTVQNGQFSITDL